MKGEVLEGGIRIPFFAQWKGNIPSGTTYDKPVISLDIAATALNLASSEGPTQAVADLEGRNLIPFFTGENTERPMKLFSGASGFQRDALSSRDGRFSGGIGNFFKKGALQENFTI